MPPLAKEIARLMQAQPAYAALGYEECVLLWANSWAAGCAGAVRLFEQAQAGIETPWRGVDLGGESAELVGRAAIRKALQR